MGNWQFVKSQGRNLWNHAAQFESNKRLWPSSVKKFEQSHNVRVVFRDGVSGNRTPIGVTDKIGTGDLPDEWCKADKHGIRKPYHTNLEGWEALNSVALVAPELNGLPKSLVEDSDDGVKHVYGTGFFVLGEDVYARISVVADYDPDIWFPISEDKFNNAMNAVGTDFHRQYGFYVVGLYGTNGDFPAISPYDDPAKNK